MKFEITLDETILQDLFEGAIWEPERLNRVTRMQRHILVGSKELLQLWRRLENTDLFRTNPTLKLQFQSWITMVVQKRSVFRMVRMNGDDVGGEPTDDQRVILGSAYQSADKIVVGDYPESLQRANPTLTFVSKAAFSKPKMTMIDWEQVKAVLLSTSNTQEYLFDIFETPIGLEVPSDSDSELLADYLARFYDDQLVIQDDYFIRNDENESNFSTYVLPRVPLGCQITLRAGVNHEYRQRGIEKQRRYESITDRSIQVACLERENLHDGYFETSKYRITIPYRLAIFGRRGKTRRCMIHITLK